MRSIDLGFLQRIDKALILPRLAFDPSCESAGAYYSPQRGEVFLGAWHPLDSGVIVCSEKFGDANVAATLAHEWRHHWQFCRGIRFDNQPWIGADDYDSELRNFFAESATERDALRFEMRIAPCGNHEPWREILEGII